MSIVLQRVAGMGTAYKLHVILTDECLLHSKKKSCDVGASLGTDAIFEQSFIMPTEGKSEWEKTASPTHIFEPGISQILRRHLHNETDSRSKLRELALVEKPTNNQEQFMNMFLPLVKIRLYVAPCSCLLMTAIQMCADLRTRYVQAIIRPDHRLRSTCCSGQKGLQHMREIADKIRGGHGFEPEGYDSEFLDQFDNIDLTWMENVIFKHDEEQTEQSASFSSANEPFSFEYEDTTTCDLLILIGEARILGPEMVKRPFTRRARIPKQSEVYVLIHDYQLHESEYMYKWKFNGRFTSQSNYQWCSLDPALNAIKESSPPPPSTTGWSIETQVQEQEPPSTISVSILGSLNVQEESKQDTSIPAKIEGETDKGSPPAETIFAA